MRIKTNSTNQPTWKIILSKASMPKELEPLNEMAHNLWWVWNHEAYDLFDSLDHELCEKTEGNPVQILQGLTLKRMEEIISDEVIMARVKEVYALFKAYMAVKPDSTKPSVAYFSMEYGLTNVLKIYSGGLGVLAGDYIKEASDSNIDLCAVGFLYRYGYFTQGLSMDGQQIASYEAQDFNGLPIEQMKEPDGNPMILEVPFLDFIVYSHIWRVNVGRVSLYLMDTDLPNNSEWDRFITHQLYGGDWENRIKQEYLLGIGGILMLKKLGIKKEIYHCNEGHAALINAQRLADYVQEDGLSFNEALQVVRATSLYTVHTPVPAGHDYFEEDLFGRYLGNYPQKLGITWREFIDMGRENPEANGKFSMSVFALNTCQEANGVSKLHGLVSQKMFAPIWKGYFPQELHVGYVTNGVHMPTWASSEFIEFYRKMMGDKLFVDQSNKKIWAKIQQADDAEIWNIRKQLKYKLVRFIRDKYRDSWMKNQGDPSKVLSVLDKINPNALMIGFGRRFATYKRAHLLFTDLDRLSKIVNNEQFPIQFVFTGKAHPADGGGQGLIKRIIEISKRPEFVGKIIFLENYDMRLAKCLISGVDVWLNTPTRPLEASGTSGEKAEMNGVLNCSVLDGWWYEGYREGAGWALTDIRTYENQEYQDQLDAARLYKILETEIIPTYYARNSRGYSPEWIKYIKNSISEIAPDFTMKRMIDDYISRFYRKLESCGRKMKANNFAKAKELAAWKEHVAANWDAFVVDDISRVNSGQEGEMTVGAAYDIGVTIDRKTLKAMLGIELVVTKDDERGQMQLVKVLPFELVEEKGTKVSFHLTCTPQLAGSYKTALRVYPVNADLPHRMDFAYLRWI